MLPSWLKTTLIVGRIVAVVGTVVFLWLLVRGANVSRRRQPTSEGKKRMKILHKSLMIRGVSRE